MAPNRRLFLFQFRLPYPLSLLYTCFFLATSPIVQWLLWVTEGFRSSVATALPIRFIFNLVAAGYGTLIHPLGKWTGFAVFNRTARQSRGCPPSVDLQQLCDSYHDEGEMGLPRELINEIMRYNDPQTLKRCSLASRAFYSAARPFIHKRVALGRGSIVRGSYPEIPPLDPDTSTLDEAGVLHTRYLLAAEERGLLRHGYVREVYLDFGIGIPENVLQLRQLRALKTVHTLTINTLDLHKFLPIFDCCFSQFVPTLRLLSLEEARCENAHQLMEFVCRFPHLDDLELINPCGLDLSVLADAPPGSKGPRLQQPPPFGGHLVLKGSPSSLVRCLLGLLGGIRFRSIEIVGSQEDLAELLVACSSTLEVLSIVYFENEVLPQIWLREQSSDFLSVDLGCNGILRLFELSVNFIRLDLLPPFLHKTLTSILSPHFSEFSLLFRQGWRELGPGGANRRRVLGAGWEVIDNDLYAHAAKRDDFRFTVKIAAGLLTVAAVEEHFPRMKSKGSLFITQ